MSVLIIFVAITLCIIGMIFDLISFECNYLYLKKGKAPSGIPVVPIVLYFLGIWLLPEYCGFVFYFLLALHLFVHVVFPFVGSFFLTPYPNQKPNVKDSTVKAFSEDVKKAD